MARKILRHHGKSKKKLAVTSYESMNRLLLLLYMAGKSEDRLRRRDEKHLGKKKMYFFKQIQYI